MLDIAQSEAQLRESIGDADSDSLAQAQICFLLSERRQDVDERLYE
ncbi:MAG: hypothetical protein ACT4QE_10780 [Anaerolineales bacterium]